MYYYHANALALGGRLRRPVDQVIESQASSMLPSSGGFGSSHVENFNFKNIVSFRVAHTGVAGSELRQKDQPIFTARASATVEGLNILNVVTADTITARLASRHPANDDEPAVITTGSYFDNLRIAGHSVEVVEFAHGTFHRCDTYKKLRNAFQLAVKDTPSKKNAGEDQAADEDADEAKPPNRRSVLDCHLGRYIKEPPPQNSHPEYVAHLKQRYEDLQEAKELPGTVVCSVVKKIVLKPKPSEIKVYGPVVVVPRFGVIILGEVILKHGMRRINMLRVELGSPDEGSVCCVSPCCNGTNG